MPKPRTRAKSAEKKTADKVVSGAVPAEEIVQEFPAISLPIQPPFPPEDAKSVSEIPRGQGWQYEPKWDGFRCLAFRSDQQVLLQSKAGQPLARYFPEVVAALTALPQKTFVIDGEIVIFSGGHLSFDDLLMRIHPAASRIRKLSAQTPGMLMCFDLLVDEAGKRLTELSLQERRARLERFFEEVPRQSPIRLSPASPEYSQAERWMGELGPMGLDGIIAKRLDETYRSGERTAMVKIKRIRTADCVLGGFRYAEKGGGIGSLLLGLYNDQKQLDHVGFCSSFNAEQRQELKTTVEPLIGPPGFTGHAPGGLSRWSTKRSMEWQPLQPKLVCEVQYDHFSGARFRHGTKFLRWRPEKKPSQCTFEQVRPGKVRTTKTSELLGVAS
ncbi:MAG TPA: ATP-dependent DNA ligase [Terriglobales bacterium]|nr:ATP-dependent DNA ligase [Terriglobales bacterium]